ncbi:MAG: FAD-dependent oxidoreductase [Verrucomicrobia bacterium]|nr:FAD-dependent oxidoreductase [Verrucomicrobiota bacterium]
MSLRIAITGAGMAGVSAGRLLPDCGHRVTLLEKSRGCGGRCATKRWEGHLVDHGAQYFTMRHSDFCAAVQQTCGESLCRITAPVLDENGAALPDAGRYYHRDGNSRLVRGMAEGLTLRTETTVTDARALLGDYDRVLSTAPLPQTAALFGLTIPAQYIPCLTVLLAYRGEPTGLCREAYALSDLASDLPWSACENHKAGRIATGCTVLVAQMSEAFSRRHLELPPANYPGLLRAMVERRWGLCSNNFLAGLGHCWRYARVAQSHAAPALPERCYFAGDALTASRVEDAWLAGRAAALNMI